MRIPKGRPRIVLIALIVAIIAVAMYLLRPGVQDRWRIDAALGDCRRIIREGEQGWGEDVGGRVQQLKHSVANKHLLAQRLLGEQDGSLVAEGMVIVAEEAFPDGEHLLQSFSGDGRWNYWLDHHDHWSRVCLLIWKQRTGRPIRSPTKIEASSPVTAF